MALSEHILALSKYLDIQHVARDKTETMRRLFQETVHISRSQTEIDRPSCVLLLSFIAPDYQYLPSSFKNVW